MNEPSLERPAMRPLDIRPFTHEGEAYLMMSDNDALAQDAAVPRELASLLALFDGTRTIEQIIEAYGPVNDEPLPRSFVERTVTDLDQNFMLDSPRFRAKLQEIANEYSNAPHRPAALAGAAYPNDAHELQTMLNGFVEQSETLGAPPKPDGKLRGCVVPHIDFRRGGALEALAYRDLRNEEFDVLVVLGIAHSGVRYPFCATTKHYDTPLGVCETDVDFVNALQNRVGNKLTAEEIAHKNEHSIEFVSVFLQSIRKLTNTRIVPILCGGFFRQLSDKTSPMQNFEIAQFVDALRETVVEWEARGQKVGIIASVDLSHVGSRFGDERRLFAERLMQIEVEDHAFLQCVGSGDCEALHAAMSCDNNIRNVDAHPALYTMFAAFPEWRAQLLAYDQAYDEEANSVVSFASMTVFDPEK